MFQKKGEIPLYVIKFIKNNHISIDFEEHFNLYNGLEQLNQFNKQALDNKRKYFVHYKIIDEIKEKDVLVDKVALGNDYRIDFFGLTKIKLGSLFSGEELENHLMLLEEIEVQYTAEKNEYYANRKAEVNEKILNSAAESSEPDSIDDKKLTDNGHNLITNKKRLKQEKKKKSKQNKSKHSYKNLILIISVSALLVLGMVFFMGNNNDNSDKSKVSFEELMIDKNFTKALEEYPEKYIDIEHEIVELGEIGIPYLEMFIDKYPDYNEAQFDLYYLEKNHDKVIENSEMANTDKRRTHLAIAYIFEDDLKKANKINHLIHDNELNRQIDEIYFHLILENVKSDNKEKVNEYMQYANSPEINDYIKNLNILNSKLNELDNLPENKKDNFFNSRKLDSLNKEKIELINSSPFIEESNSNLNLTIISFPLIIMLILALAYFGMQLIKNKEVKEEEKGFELYLQNKMYMIALKEFPHKYPEIERTIFLQGESEIPYLEEFITKKKNYKQAYFDLAFLKKEYDKVIDLEKFADTDARKAQLAIAYIQQGELDLANDINQIIQVPELSYYLNEHYYQLTVLALKNDDYDQAFQYQDLGNSPDIDYLIETIKMINKRIEEINSNRTQQDDPKVIYKLQRLREAKAMSLNLD